jgi:hypothetical protein
MLKPKSTTKPLNMKTNKKGHKIHLLGLIIVVTISLQLNATNYYISNTGNDLNNGTTTVTAWQTLEKINSTSFIPGDSILFKRGDTWRNDELRIASSGIKNNPIAFSAYGFGERPAILGSIQATNFSNVSGNIWSASESIETNPWTVGYDNTQIFFEEDNQEVIWGEHQTYDASYSNLSNDYDWTWNNNTLYIYSSQNPNTKYTSVEVPQLAQGILLLDNNYITIDGLAIKYLGDAGIYDQYATVQLYGLRVTNCEIGFIGQKEGSAAYGLNVHHSDSYYAYNEIHDCGRRGISLTMYNTDPITQSNVIIEHNHFHHGWHTTSLDCNTTGDHIIENIYFRNNFIEGSPDVELNGVNPNSNHIFCANQSSGSGVVHNLYFYNNIFTYAHGSTIKLEDVEDVFIYNNTFYNFNPSLSNWQAHVFAGQSRNVNILNNIFYNNANTNMWASIECHNSTVGEITANYNLYYNIDPGRRLFWIDGGTSYDVEQWDTYKSATGKDANSPTPSDPLFIIVPTNFGITQNSPARESGLAIAIVSTDYLGYQRSNPPDIGAYQYNDGSLTSTSSIIKNEEVKIYPNPLNDFVSIKSEIGSKISVIDLSGVLLYERYSTESITTLSCNLKSGVYMVHIVNINGKMLTKKIIVR